MTILDEYRACPDEPARRRLKTILQVVASAVVSRYRRRLPPWLSLGALRTEVAEGLEIGLDRLVYLPIEFDGVADYIEDQIEAHIAPLFVRVPSDRTPRGHVVKRGGRYRSGVVEARWDEHDDDLDYRDARQQILDAMFPRCKTKTQRTLVASLQAGDTLCQMRDKTNLRGPDIIKTLFDIR